MISTTEEDFESLKAGFERIEAVLKRRYRCSATIFIEAGVPSAGSLLWGKRGNRWSLWHEVDGGVAAARVVEGPLLLRTQVAERVGALVHALNVAQEEQTERVRYAAASLHEQADALEAADALDQAEGRF